MIRGSQVLLVCLLVALTFVLGCEDGVKRSLHDKVMARAEEGKARIKSNLDARDLTLKESLTAVLAKMDEADKASADFVRVRAELLAKLTVDGGEAPAMLAKANWRTHGTIASPTSTSRGSQPSGARTEKHSGHA